MQPAVDTVQTIGFTSLRLSYIAAHSFCSSNDMAAILREAAPQLVHVGVADTFNHKKNS